MLPFTKRPYRGPEASELINTDEIQVIAAAAAGLASDDARTVVYNGSKPKKAVQSKPPPAAREATVTIPKPAPLPKMEGVGEKTNLRGLVRPVRDDERTMLRPMTSTSAKPSRSSSSPTNLATPYAPSATPFAMSAVANPHDSIRPVSMSKDNDSLPLGTVITQKTQFGVRKPGVSWAAALMAVGVFLGLVTAVIARGDADALIEATASVVDPSHAAARPTGGQAMQAAAGASLVPVSIPKREVPVIQVTPPEPPPAAPVSAAPATPVVASPLVTPAPVVAAPLAGSKAKANAHGHQAAAAASAKPASSSQKPEVPAVGAQNLTHRADEELEGVMRAIGH